MGCCDDPEVTIEDMLRCLDHKGAVASAGARALYVRTNRDGIGWGPVDPYIMDRADWEAYLRSHGISW
jgi:hypothetical protein